MLLADLPKRHICPNSLTPVTPSYSDVTRNRHSRDKKSA